MSRKVVFFLVLGSIVLIAITTITFLYYRNSIITQDTNTPQNKALQIKRECQDYTYEVTGLNEDSFDRCYLNDLQAWIQCPSPELDEYNRILQKCMKDKGVYEDPESTEIL